LGKNKEELQLIDYLKEKDISFEKIKTMIDESIDTALEEEEDREEEKVEPEPEPKEPEVEPEPEVPPFTIDDVKKLVAEEVKNSLKIKRKVPSKGKIVDKTELQDEPATETKRDVAVKDWYERIV